MRAPLEGEEQVINSFFKQDDADKASSTRKRSFVVPKTGQRLRQLVQLRREAGSRFNENADEASTLSRTAPRSASSFFRKRKPSELQCEDDYVSQRSRKSGFSVRSASIAEKPPSTAKSVLSKGNL